MIMDNLSNSSPVVLRVLVERPAAKNPRELTGRTEGNRWVNFPGDARLMGRFAAVPITEVRQNSLRGRLAGVTGARVPSRWAARV